MKTAPDVLGLNERGVAELPQEGRYPDTED
jgi:hypothetical protein